MLRINLLPIRQLKKRAKARNQIIISITLLGFICLILGAVGFLQINKIKNIETSITKLRAEIQTYAPILAEMKRLEQAKIEYDKKTSIIKQLQRDSATTVRILDEVAKNVDSKRMWLKSLKQQGTSLSLTGIALDNRTIAQFMNALKESPYISGVNLSNSSLAKVSGRDLKSFALACSITVPQENTQEATKKN
jgi:type IV pilus assembly protein PilN